ncbi:MAG: response regulator [Lachnospiraceae bacterium]|nr:response regulator [Lachnospiraceae bacterium]
MYRILAVDDEVTERSVVRFLLEKNYKDRFQIEETTNGKDALEIIRAKKVDILLTDVQMPFMSGIELAREARKISPDTEILFFSGFDDFEYVQSALVLHAVNYILKPLNPDQFISIIGDILTRLDSKVIAFAKSSGYYRSSFYADSGNDEEKDESAGSIRLLLNQIHLAIELKQPDRLEELTGEVLGIMAEASRRSHIYIRHSAMSLLQMIMEAISSLEENDIDRAAEKVYSFRFFSDIEALIRHYMDILISELHREVDSSNYSVYLVKQYIEDHYREDLSLSLLADLVYLSPNYLSNMFTKVTGSSLNRYIRQFRLEKARTLLVESNMKISEIGSAVGFTSTSYFIRTFQKVYGITPVNYRSEYLSGRSTGQSEDEEE